MVSALVIVIDLFLKFRHLDDNDLLAGQRYSLAVASHLNSLFEMVPSLRFDFSQTGECGSIP